MSPMSLRQRKQQGGFTLIELLVVVLVIGILASIAIPAFLGQRKKAQDTAAKSLLRSGVIAAESHYSEQQSFVGLTEALLADHEQNVDWQIKPGVEPTAQAKADQIDVEEMDSGTAYVMSTQSVTGTVFSYVRNPSGAVYRCSGTTRAAATTGCAGTYAGGW